ncbi:hypothetical protein H5410_027145 [Solanum commersonii]|uniref:Uncharacterized protein n=1 Tax=Solanum commersonii TaxID=4109 RepID=A0A9J5Z0H5_SOLCO|nr:hypothetical protein H5410_027145 [Solanum commersonii]
MHVHSKEECQIGNNHRVEKSLHHNNKMRSQRLRMKKKGNIHRIVSILITNPTPQQNAITDLQHDMNENEGKTIYMLMRPLYKIRRSNKF